MTDTTDTMHDEIRQLKERLEGLARAKAQLELKLGMLERLTLGHGLDETVQNILDILMETIGAADISVYYRLGEAWHCKGLFAETVCTGDPDDPTLLQAVGSRAFVRKSAEPLGGIASENWYFPLLYQESVVGVVRMHGMLLTRPNIQEDLEQFCRYGALVLHNAINNYQDLVRLNAELEQRVSERTAQLASANQALTREIEQRRQAQEEIGQLNEGLVRQKSALEVANRELESFSYSVSHDLRAPLRHISGFVGALLEDYGNELNPTAHDYLQRVVTASEKMGDLIDALLKLSRLSRGEMVINRLDLSAMAREIVTALHAADPDRQVRVTIADNITADGDETLLRAALENLLANAWKYTRRSEAPAIEFGSYQEGRRTVCYVRDNGAGFDMAYAGKLFGAFQRLHRQEEYEGVGIGLATVQRIVHRHGGSVWAEGKVGEGATFYFTLTP